jgi:hypothetical protein
VPPLQVRLVSHSFVVAVHRMTPVAAGVLEGFVGGAEGVAEQIAMRIHRSPGGEKEREQLVIRDGKPGFSAGRRPCDR